MNYGLYPRFPGAKRPLIPQFDWGACLDGVDTMVSPFSGAACVEHYLLQRGIIKRLYVADADPTIRAAWECVKGAAADEWQPSRFGFIPTMKLPRWANSHRDFMQHFLNEQLEDWANSFKFDFQMAWASLVKPFESESSYEDLPLDAYAASLVLRRLTFGGVVRSSKTNSGLNIKAVSAQIPTLEGFTFDLPWIPADCQVLIFDDWQDCIEAAIADGVQGAFSFIDPPYYSEKPMDPCYYFHAPRKPQTLAMAVESVQRLRPISSWVFACNYITSALSDAYADAGHCTENGVIDVMANHGNKATKNIEAFWQWGNVQALATERFQQLELIK